MKKIGILTYYYQSKNIGGLLQALAMIIVLKNNLYDAEQISFNYNSFPRSILQKSYRKIYSILKKCLRYIFQYKIITKCYFQNKLFKEFESYIPHSVKIYKDNNIKQSNEYYDVFILGSDQIWNKFLLSLSAYYGEFATQNKKIISYAASSDVKSFPSIMEQIFIKKTHRINAISVREKTLKEYIESITDKKVTVVLDPTFLLSKEEWLQISNPKIVPNKKYIFCYFLGGKSVWQRKIAQAYADKYSYEVIHLPYIMQTIRPADKYLKGQDRYDVGPREFISLINNSECMFTDSFHGLAFSINFNKNFYVFNRDDKSGALSMNARITDILDMLGLTSRHITDNNSVLDNSPIDYTQANEILKEKKEKSIKWLLNALKS